MSPGVEVMAADIIDDDFGYAAFGKWGGTPPGQYTLHSFMFACPRPGVVPGYATSRFHRWGRFGLVILAK